jgi:hypothetical protein
MKHLVYHRKSNKKTDTPTVGVIADEIVIESNALEIVTQPQKFTKAIVYLQEYAYVIDGETVFIGDKKHFVQDSHKLLEAEGYLPISTI